MSPGIHLLALFDRNRVKGNFWRGRIFFLHLGSFNGQSEFRLLDRADQCSLHIRPAFIHVLSQHPIHCRIWIVLSPNADIGT